MVRLQDVGLKLKCESCVRSDINKMCGGINIGLVLCILKLKTESNRVNLHQFNSVLNPNERRLDTFRFNLFLDLVGFVQSPNRLHTLTILFIIFFYQNFFEGFFLFLFYENCILFISYFKLIMNLFGCASH